MFKLVFLLSMSCHCAYTLLKLRRDLHILQLNSYMNIRYYKWLMGNASKTFHLKDLMPVLTLFALPLQNAYIYYSIWIISYVILLMLRTSTTEKKPLVFTARAKRLYFVNVLILISIYFVISIYHIQHNMVADIYLFSILIFISSCSLVLMFISNSVISPVESLINRWYYRDAQKCIVGFRDLTVIGITGSFGKTSTKHILHRILSQKFNTLMTPGSFNTTMGVVKTIRVSLRPVHQVFIVEMGAKQKGDISELCRLVSPKFGVLTAVGEQHLESFGSVENVMAAKNELIESLPHDGMAFFNMDDPNCRRLAPLAHVRSVRYGIDSDGLQYQAKNISMSSSGSSFDLYKYDGSKVRVQTRLLGKHNVYNILAGAAIAGEMGMSLDAIAIAMATMQPVPHRLELKRTPQNITLIDDSFNSNVVGFNMALEVLENISANKKILVTPGMVELGEKEYELNRSVGIRAAEVCDYIILVGPKQTIPIQHGLQSRDYPSENCYVAKNLDDANRQLSKIARSGDIVLFENDLPDTYNEI